LNLYEAIGKALGVDEPETDEAPKAAAPKHGPAKFGWITEGRANSQERRRNVAARRRQNAKHRRDWMLNERRVSALRGQLEVLDDPNASAILKRNAVEGILTKFETIDAARDHYASLAEERRRLAKQQRAQRLAQSVGA
jgi:hypothetical protein